MRVAAHLVGNVVDAPERRELPSGDRVITFRVATDDGYRDPSGRWQPLESTFWRCEAWGDLADRLAQELVAGSPVAVHGHFRTHSWTPTGETKKRSRLVVYVEAGGINLGAGRASAPSPEEGASSDDAPAVTSPLTDADAAWAAE